MTEISTTNLADHEKILSLDHSFRDHSVDALANLFLVLVDEGPVDVSIAGGDRCFHGLRHLTWLGLQGGVMG